jgi:poly-gamma-glutamate capsule biosynthesis protein CapA/YwtB (metallophosphatase superfamily)
MRIFLCGDVMTGRGIDQVLPHPCDPCLHEAHMRSAKGYFDLAVKANGPIKTPVDFSYIWGAALEEWERASPDLRIINLETSITHNATYAAKGINYRMSPENAACLAAAEPDCCVLANNHVLDWMHAGLLDTLATLERLLIKTAGAGRNVDEASAPAALTVAGAGRVLVFSFALPTAGVPPHWAATQDTAGVNLLPSLSAASVAAIADQVAAVRQAGDVVIISIHWGPNWGYVVTDEQRLFAHALIDEAGASIVYGHSSHHAKTIEVYRNRLILYGCGDFLNDYEGISGYEHFRPDLAVMYLADLDPKSLDLAALELVPLKIRRFQLVRAASEDISWLQQTLDRQSRHYDTRVTMAPEGRLAVSWPAGGT